MTRRPRDASVGPWAREKLDALRQYLNYYTTVLKNQTHWCRGTIFVDAFAGPGLSRVREKSIAHEPPGLFGPEPESDTAEVEFLKGSPRIALEIANPFTRYIFIERDPQRAAELRSIQTDYGETRSIAIRPGDANAELKAWLTSGIDWQHHRSVVFLDPFGMQVPWSTIASLANTKAIEVIINFPLGMAIQRMLTRSGDIPVGWQISLDTFFGSKDWRLHAYEESRDLLGPKVSKLDDANVRLLQWYRAKLRTAFGHVSTARLIKNTRGSSLYYLIWAGPHSMGQKGAEYILSKGETVRSQRGA